jgi:hypothetical protein
VVAARCLNLLWFHFKTGHGKSKTKWLPYGTSVKQNAKAMVWYRYIFVQYLQVLVHNNGRQHHAVRRPEEHEASSLSPPSPSAFLLLLFLLFTGICWLLVVGAVSASP